MAQTPRRICVFTALALSCVLARAQDANLTDLDLSTLMNMDVTVTSAAKRAQSTAEAAAAVYVITREDIRRSGAMYIPDLLRLVPGLQVARINTRSWAVTARGFNSKFANKLQVMVDGRSIYAMVFSGVMWEEQFVPVDQIERIEVIRGPGGALWGINAVNGVINIITRRASEDQGLHVSAGAGGRISNAAGLHYGGEALGGALHAYVDHADADAFSGDPTDLDRSQGGVRYERSRGPNMFTARADFSSANFGNVTSELGPSLPPTAEVGGAQVGWRRDHASGAQAEISAYYSWTDRGDLGGWDESMSGLDVQYIAARRGRHLLTYGANYRHVTDQQSDPVAASAFTVAALNYDQWSGYVQDESFWFGERLRITAGAKLEDFKYGDMQFQPTLRALWRASERHTFWSAASRAARAPSRFELHASIDTPLPFPGAPTFLRILGNEDVGVEDLYAYELGWRWRPGRAFSLDVAAFVHDYKDLIVPTEQAPIFVPGAPPTLILPLLYDNAAAADSHGVEAAFEWVASERLRFQANAAWLHMNLPELPNALNTYGAEPEYTAAVRARFELSAAAELDVVLRAVDALKTQPVEAYQSLDARVGWRPTEALCLSFSVENLLNDEHVEFYDEVGRAPGVTLGRSAFFRLTWGMNK